MDHIGSVQVVYMDGRVTDESFNRYLEAMVEEMDARPKVTKMGVLYHVPNPSAVSSERRKRIGAILKERRGRLKDAVEAYVMVTSSPIVRFSLKMLFWLAPPPYRNEVTTDLLEGFQFVARHHDCGDANELLAAYERILQEARPEMEPE